MEAALNIQDDIEIGPMLEVEVPIGNVQDDMEGVPTPVVASNENTAARMRLLQTAGPTIAFGIALYTHLQVGPLDGLYIFAVHGSLIMGLMLLLLGLVHRWAGISTATVEKLMWLNVALIKLALFLKMILRATS